MPYAQLALLIVKLLGVPGPYTMALDRTNWKVGAVDLNILMLSIIYRGVGIPVVWIVLSKAGNSDTSERTTVMEIFLDLFGAQNIACLLGDREFVGRVWFRFLMGSECQRTETEETRLSAKEHLTQSASEPVLWVHYIRQRCDTSPKCSFTQPSQYIVSRYRSPRSGSIATQRAPG
jgi:hypothetical protein